MHGDAHGHAHPRRGNLLDNLQVNLIRLCAAADLLGIWKGEQTRATQQGKSIAGELGGFFGGTGDGCEMVGADLTGQVDEVLRLLGGHEAFCWHGGNDTAYRAGAIRVGYR